MARVPHDDVTNAILAACDRLFSTYVERLWGSRRIEFEVWPARRRDRSRRVTTEGFELTGIGTADENEWPGYFEPVRERRWFGGEWVAIQPVTEAASRIEERLRLWAGE